MKAAPPHIDGFYFCWVIGIANGLIIAFADDGIVFYDTFEGEYGNCEVVNTFFFVVRYIDG